MQHKDICLECGAYLCTKDHSDTSKYCKFCGRELYTREQREAEYCDARCKMGAMAQWV